MDVPVSDVMSGLGAIAGLGAVLYAHKAEIRAARAEGSAEAISRLQALALNQQLIDGFKNQLKPHYGNSGFMEEAKRLIREGTDPRIVIRAVELAVAEVDDQISRRARRIIDYRAILLDLADEISRGKSD